MVLQLTDILANGYFAKELPPPFTTAAYSQAAAVAPAGTFDNRPFFSPICEHNLVRTGGLRRILGIPNPKHFFRLCQNLVANWQHLTALTARSQFSLTKPIDGRPGRAISAEHGLGERTVERARLRSAARFVLHADITRFFPSVYTHSIPWAVLGKAAAKAAHAAHALAGTWHDDADTFSRSINNNQTVGIPIGPDTSHAISELILAQIDVELADRYPDLRGIRYVDDYEFAFATRAEAEGVLAYFQHLLSEYELALNPVKTSITELPEILDRPWASTLRVFVFRHAGVAGQRNDLTAYFNMVFDFFRRYPEEGLLKYAIARLRGEEIHHDNWPFLETLLSQSVLVEPACIPQVTDQISYYRIQRFPINRRLWADCLNRIVHEQAPLGHGSEAAWAMWLMKLLRIRLLMRPARAVGESADSIAGLMALGLAASGLAQAAHLNGLHHFHPPDELFEKHWLTCYQGNLMQWLGPASGRANLRRDQAFAFLEGRNVSFFDIDVAAPPPIRPPAPAGFGGGGLGY
jgi:reverse transcriptase-like protein